VLNVKSVTVLLVRFAEEMGIKIVDVVASLSANITTPRTRVRMTSFMEKVECYVWKYNFAVDALMDGVWESLFSAILQGL